MMIPEIPLLMFLTLVGFCALSFVWMQKRAGYNWAKVAGLVLAWAVLTGALPFVFAKFGFGVASQPLVLVVLILGVVWFASLARSDRVGAAVPMAVLIGVQGFRLPLELVLARWHGVEYLPSAMSYHGQNFDIVTGVLALILAAWMAFASPPRWVLIGFNWLGLLLLANIARIVALSAGMPLSRLLGTTPEPIQIRVGLDFPTVWLATICVALAIWLHAVCLRALR